MIPRLRYFSTSYRKVELLRDDLDETQFTSETVAGATLFSLVSAGTEIHGPYLNCQRLEYPLQFGYAAVFRAEFVGSAVKGIEVGDTVFCSGPHAGWQAVNYHQAIRVPDGVLPQEALFPRMAAVSMASIRRTRTCPGDSIVVTGLGTVGICAMQMYTGFGYKVVGTDPNTDRARLAAEVTGLPCYAELDESFNDHFGLALECSGTQQATLDCCRLVREEGEIALVGVPWQKTGNVQSYDILNRIFYKYLTCFTGWECDLPVTSTTKEYVSHIGQITQAMEFLRDGKLKVKGLYEIHDFINPQLIYDSIYEKNIEKPSVILRWEEK